MNAGVHDAGALPAPDFLNAVVGLAAAKLEVGKRSGLGRSLADGVVQKHRGRIEVQSDGKSTPFRIRLPVDEPGENA